MPCIDKERQLLLSVQIESMLLLVCMCLPVLIEVQAEHWMGTHYRPCEFAKQHFARQSSICECAHLHMNVMWCVRVCSEHEQSLLRVLSHSVSARIVDNTISSEPRPNERTHICHTTEIILPQDIVVSTIWHDSMFTSCLLLLNFIFAVTFSEKKEGYA